MECALTESVTTPNFIPRKIMRKEGAGTESTVCSMQGEFNLVVLVVVGQKWNLFEIRVKYSERKLAEYLI